VSRFPVGAFGVLVVATVAAFFITQHLKTSTPLLTGTPSPLPAAIDPLADVTCFAPGAHKYVNHRQMQISFWLQNRSDHVDVYVVNPAGRVIATLATDRYMQGGSNPKRSWFFWNGRESNGQIAPDGKYYIRVRLIGARRTVTISNQSGPLPVTVITVPPQPLVTSVAPNVISQTRPAQVKISYSGNEGRSATVVIYRIGPHGGLLQVKKFVTAWASTSAIWDGRISKLPASAGRYLLGLQVTDAACNTGYFPATNHPRLAAVSQAIVTVRP
jgi:hypothetical protein